MGVPRVRVVRPRRPRRGDLHQPIPPEDLDAVVVRPRRGQHRAGTQKGSATQVEVRLLAERVPCLSVHVGGCHALLAHRGLALLHGREVVHALDQGALVEEHVPEPAGELLQAGANVTVVHRLPGFGFALRTVRRHAAELVDARDDVRTLLGRQVVHEEKEPSTISRPRTGVREQGGGEVRVDDLAHELVNSFRGEPRVFLERHVHTGVVRVRFSLAHRALATQDHEETAGLRPRPCVVRVNVSII